MPMLNRMESYFPLEICIMLNFWAVLSGGPIQQPDATALKGRKWKVIFTILLSSLKIFLQWKQSIVANPVQNMF